MPIFGRGGGLDLAGLSMNSVWETILLALNGFKKLLIVTCIALTGHVSFADDGLIHWVPEQNITAQNFSRLDVRVRPRQHEGIDLRKLVPDQNRVVIGLENRKHAYLVVGNVRFDGRILHDPQATVYTDELPVGRGAFVILENLPLSTVTALREAVLSTPNQAYFGCVHAVLSKLADAGIRTAPTDEVTIYTARLLEVMRTGGFVLNGNQRVQTKFFATSDIDMARWPSQLAQQDREVSGSIAKTYRGMSPDAMMEKIAGRVRPISPELRLLMSKMTSSQDQQLMDYLKTLTREIPAHAVVTWSRAPIEIALGRKLTGSEIGQAMVTLGFRPLDQYLPRPEVWTAAHNIDCVLQYANDTHRDEPLYSLTEAYQMKRGSLNLHSVELRIWRSLGRKIIWSQPSFADSLNSVANDYLDLVQTPEVVRRFGNNPAVRSVIDPNNYSSNVDVPKDPTYWQLMADMDQEIDQWFKATEAESAKSQWRRMLSQSSQSGDDSSAFEGIWPPRKISKNSNAKDFVPVVVSADVASHPHGIAGLKQYLERRLGRNVVEMLRSHKISVKVFASFDPQIPPGDSFVELPSLYAKRGVRKFFSSQSKTLIINIPPLTEFAQHYAAMLRLIDSSNDVKVWISRGDRTRYKQKIQDLVTETNEGLEKDPRHFIIGGSPWIQTGLRSANSIWEVRSQRTKTNPEYGIMLDELKLRHKSTGLLTTIVIVNSMQYRWGEGSAFLADALLALGAKSLTFVGNVGGPGVGEPNEISVPDQFFLKGQEVQVGNYISRFAPHNVTQSAELHFGTVHAHSYSPIEQTIPFVKNFVDKGYETVDVEQTLVADQVARFNAQTGKRIAFGAINLITDKPRSSLAEPVHEADLDNQNFDKRSGSIRKALDLFEVALLRLETESSRFSYPSRAKTCPELLSGASAGP
jgi:hypothetical protein